MACQFVPFLILRLLFWVNGYRDQGLSIQLSKERRGGGEDVIDKHFREDVSMAFFFVIQHIVSMLDEYMIS